jgi:hypothetical protein
MAVDLLPPLPPEMAAASYREPALCPAVEKHRQDLRRLIVEALQHALRSDRFELAHAGRRRLPRRCDPMVPPG